MSSTIQFAAFCFLLFFALSQFFQWAQHLTLPLPIFILGGAFLAIASNFDRRAGFPFNLLNAPETPANPTAQAPTPEQPAIPQTSASQAPKEISFTIRKSEKTEC